MRRGKTTGEDVSPDDGVRPFGKPSSGEPVSSGKPAPSGEPAPVEYPVDGTLDLHLFNPREVKELVPHYLRECSRRGILQVRLVHGKGTGVLRSKVHSILRRLKEVQTFRLAGEDGGGWGATIVSLHRPDDALDGEGKGR